MSPAIRAAQIARAADEKVAGWSSLTAEQRAELMSLVATQPHVEDVQSGGAWLSVNGVDRWFPSRRDALAELAARVLP